MIYFSLEVMTKWRGHDYETMDVVRENFSDVYGVIKNLFLMTIEINTIRLKQYSYNNGRTTLLNCFNIKFPGNNAIYEPIFEYDNVSYCL